MWRKNPGMDLKTYKMNTWNGNLPVSNAYAAAFSM
jgi:hypothetical protein